jgi:non-ribosomal peptide synthetase component F
MGYGKKSRVFQFASYAFDACITDIFATLVHGGTVCIPSEWERNNAIVDAMNRMEVTNAKFTPSLATNLTFENVPTLKTLILGGESASPSFIEKWASKLRLILVYGEKSLAIFSAKNWLRLSLQAPLNVVSFASLRTPAITRQRLEK